MPVTKQENRKKESSEIKKVIKAFEKEIKENDNQIKNEKKEIKKWEKLKLNINDEKEGLSKEIKKLKIALNEIKNKLKEKKEKNIKYEEKEVKFKEKDLIKLENLRKEIENKVEVEEKQQQQIQENITKLKENEQEIINELEKFKKNEKEMEEEIGKLKETIVDDDTNVNLLIKEKENEILEVRLKIANLSDSLKRKEKEITLLEFEEFKHKQIILENKEQLIKANHKLYSNKKTENEVKIAELEIKKNKRICEIYELQHKLNIVVIDEANINSKILSLLLTICRLEKSSIKIVKEITEKKDVLKRIKNNSLEESIIISPEENVTSTQQNAKPWFKRIYKPFTKLYRGSKQKLTLVYYQRKEKSLEAEIRKLEAEKLKDFWNKFWLLMSCGCYNNHGKTTRKIEEKKRELKDIKKELEKLSKNNISNNDPQPSTSSAVPSSSKSWSDKLLKSTEEVTKNDSLLKENSKNPDISLH
ncbi:hypothetical protein [Spiroplasma endosymbiont of Panzeria rudis]|uniref:hypothetical protein n=1 Tax=Spiroplasma endosymbiont of Panzeria rudis TaxID=3066301 RepID=UPI0030D0986D